VVAFSVVAAFVSYYLKVNGVLDSLTAEYYVSGLKTRAHGAIDTAQIVTMQKDGTFPAVMLFADAVIVSTLLTLVRVFLTDFVFSPVGSSLMALHNIPNQYKKR